ncbi:MAG: amidohydrolase family protein [Sphingomonadales bacterium]|nr:amidohydrolase family protein [Sphingomonadales bacterium]
MLIRDAEIWGHGRADLRIVGGRIAGIGALAHAAGEAMIDARGGALLPGLHDHHIHLAALAARAGSVVCGPPEVRDEAALAARLRAVPGAGWLRGIGYHESVAGLPDAGRLDALLCDRPLRLQHRSGRLWLLNSRALETLLALAPPPPGLRRRDGRYTGHLFDEDAWLRKALAGAPPGFAAVSAALACTGVTGLTDMSPANDTGIAAHFAAERACGALRQRVVLAGAPALRDAPREGWSLGPAKLHLHEAALPDFAAATAFTRAAHADGRPVAVHCTTEVELVFALAAIAAAGALTGDRIEHAGIADPGHIGQIAALGLAVASQPHFIAERGDAYLRDVEPRHHRNLYRLASLADAGIALAAGSDAPFGSHDPWAAMRAAVSRTTAAGQVIGAGEALGPEAALSLYLADPLDLQSQRRLGAGAHADLCLLARPWAAARTRLSAGDVRLTIIGGSIVHQRIDQPPA